MAQPIQHYTAVEEYLWQEQRANFKHDFFNGQVYNMASGSPEHSIIAVNLTSELRILLLGKECQWKVNEPLEDLTASIHIACLNLDLSLAALYESLDFTEHSDV